MANEGEHDEDPADALPDALRPWCIVPAHNEGPRIGAVLDVLVRCPELSGVLVVDDGSKDDTVDVAKEAGVEVISLSPNRGKAQAMKVGIAQVPGEHIMFADADLRGFRPEHVSLLVEHARAGWDLVCGLREYDLLNCVQLVMPLITGERVVSREVLDAVHPSCWDGYSIELAMNHACGRIGGRIVAVPLRGLRIVGKVGKGGIVEGLRGQVKMFSKLKRVQCNLEDRGSCEVAPLDAGVGCDWSGESVGGSVGGSA